MKDEKGILMTQPVALHSLKSLNITATQVCKEEDLPLDTDAPATCNSYPKKFEQNCYTIV